MFSETCLKYKLYRSLLQPLPILEPSPKTFQSNLWLRIAQSEQQIFIKQDQDQHTARPRSTASTSSSSPPFSQPTSTWVNLQTSSATIASGHPRNHEAKNSTLQVSHIAHENQFCYPSYQAHLVQLTSFKPNCHYQTSY